MSNNTYPGSHASCIFGTCSIGLLPLALPARFPKPVCSARPSIHVEKDVPMRILDGENREWIPICTLQGIRSRQPTDHLVQGVRRGGALRSSGLVLSLVLREIIVEGASLCRGVGRRVETLC